MADRQLDFFDDVRPRAPAVSPKPAELPLRDPRALGDQELLGGLEDLPMAECLQRAREIGRRRLPAGVEALEALCRRHAGFGRTRLVPEQAAAIEALRATGGAAAGAAIGRLIGRRLVEGPGLCLAFSAAAALRSPLPPEAVAEHLQSEDACLRAAAARCVRVWPQLAPALIDLLDDRHGEVRTAAACALARMGRREGRLVLVAALGDNPTAELVDALASIADEDIIVVLGRLADRRPELSAVVVAALEDLGEPKAEKVLDRLRAGPARAPSI
jgi:hypothetical protein